MAYAAVVSLENTIDRFLNHNHVSISLEEKQQVTSLLEYVSPFQGFLEELPDKFKSLEGRMREAASEAEDILEYLVLEKVFLPCDQEYHNLELKVAVKETRSMLKKAMKEFPEDFPDELEERLHVIGYEAEENNYFFKWKKTHTRVRDKWRCLPTEFAKFKSKHEITHHLNKARSEIDSIMEEVMAIKNNRDADATTSSSKLAPIDDVVGLHDDDDDDGDDDDDDDDGEEEEDGDDDDDESICHRTAKHELKLEKVVEEIALIAAEVKKIKHSSTRKQIQRGAKSSAISSSPTTSIHADSPVGFHQHVMDLKGRLCGESSKLQVIPICGMGGIGKTTLARNVYDDRLIVEYFVIRVWVTISQDYSAERILASILESLNEYNTDGLGQGDDVRVHKILMGRRYLVVMDDIWSGEAWDVVRRVFPDDGNGSRVVLTTRLSDVASYPDPSSKLHEMSLLSVDQSWELFKQKVFADEDCPSELENIGKEIARSCKGLPLAVVVIAGLVSTVSKNPTSWLEIAENVSSAETTEHNHIEEILSLSYIQLPQYLRPCFLYMASFPEDHEIHVSRLIRLWVAEGFVKSPINSKSLEQVAEECLEELVRRNLVLVTKRKFDGRTRRCSLHDLMRDLCIRKAHESKFFLNLMGRNIKKAHFIESIKDQRRVSVDSYYMEYLSRCHGSSIHSIKISDNRPGDLDFIEGFRLVRVLDAEAVEILFSLPSQLDDLFHLRYFAVSYSSGIPTVLSCLQNLQTLIIHRSELGSVSTAGNMLMSWCMPQIRHVYFHGEILFEDPRESTCSLENLHTLSRVDSTCCTEQILKRIPNLIKMKMGYPREGDAACLNDLVHLKKLENFEVCGRHCLDWIPYQAKYYRCTFPETLKKLTLTYLELPCIDIIGSLPNLQVLKFRSCVFADGTWETIEGAFPVLQVLLIKSSSFKDWITESSHFPRLRRLLLHSCEDLGGIPNDIGEIPTLELIEVTGKAIKESLMESVEQIRQEQEELGNDSLRILCIAMSSR